MGSAEKQRQREAARYEAELASAAGRSIRARLIREQQAAHGRASDAPHPAAPRRYQYAPQAGPSRAANFARTVRAKRFEPLNYPGSMIPICPPNAPSWQKASINLARCAEGSVDGSDWNYKSTPINDRPTYRHSVITASSISDTGPALTETLTPDVPDIPPDVIEQLAENALPLDQSFLRMSVADTVVTESDRSDFYYGGRSSRANDTTESLSAFVASEADLDERGTVISEASAGTFGQKGQRQAYAPSAAATASQIRRPPTLPMMEAAAQGYQLSLARRQAAQHQTAPTGASGAEYRQAKANDSGNMPTSDSRAVSSPHASAPSVGTPLGAAAIKEATSEEEDSEEGNTRQRQQSKRLTKVDQILGEGAEEASRAFEQEKKILKQAYEQAVVMGPTALPDSARLTDHPAPRHRVAGGSASPSPDVDQGIFTPPHLNASENSHFSRSTSTTNDSTPSVTTITKLLPSGSDRIPSPTSPAKSHSRRSPRSPSKAASPRSSRQPSSPPAVSTKNEMSPQQREAARRSVKAIAKRLGEVVPEEIVSRYIVPPVQSPTASHKRGGSEAGHDRPRRADTPDTYVDSSEGSHEDEESPVPEGTNEVVKGDTRILAAIARMRRAGMDEASVRDYAVAWLRAAEARDTREGASKVEDLELSIGQQWLSYNGSKPHKVSKFFGEDLTREQMANEAYYARYASKAGLPITPWTPLPEVTGVDPTKQPESFMTLDGKAGSSKESMSALSSATLRNKFMGLLPKRGSIKGKRPDVRAVVKPMADEGQAWAASTYAKPRVRPDAARIDARDEKTQINSFAQRVHV